MISCPFSTNFYKQFPFFFLKKKKGSKTNNNKPKGTAPKGENDAGDNKQAAFPQQCRVRSGFIHPQLWASSAARAAGAPAGLRLNIELGLVTD